MKILFEEPEGLENPWNGGSKLDVEFGLFTGFWEGALAQKKLYEARLVDVDLDKMLQQYVQETDFLDAHKGMTHWKPLSFTGYLKEQLGGK